MPLNSAAHVYFTAQINGATSYYPLPSVVALGDINPGVSAALTFYANAGTPLVATVLRSGDTTDSETDYITVTGYYDSP